MPVIHPFFNTKDLF